MAAKFISGWDTVNIRDVTEEQFLASVEKCVRDYLLTSLPEGEIEVSEGMVKIKESPVQTLIGIRFAVTINYNQTIALIGDKLTALLSKGVSVSMERTGTSHDTFYILLTIGVGKFPETEEVVRSTNHAAINTGMINGVPSLMARGIFPVIDGETTVLNWVKNPEEFRSITAELDWVE